MHSCNWIILILCGILCETLPCLSRRSIVVVKESGNADLMSPKDIFENGTFDVLSSEVKKTDDFDQIRNTVCSTIASAKNPIFLIDFTSIPIVKNVLSDISGRLNLPYLHIKPMLQEPGLKKDVQIQLHPNALIQMVFLKDYFEKVFRENQWAKGAIIVHDNPTELANFQSLLKSVKQNLLIRKWSGSMLEKKRIFQDLKKKNITYLVIALKPNVLPSLFTTMSEVDYLSKNEQILLTHPEASTVDLSRFSSNNTQIESLRVNINGGTAVVSSWLSDLIRSLLNYANSIPMVVQSWELQCAGKPWTQGEKFMRNFMDEVKMRYGLIETTSSISVPIPNYRLNILTLRDTGFEKVATWQHGDGFRPILSKLPLLSRRVLRQSRRTLSVVSILSDGFLMKEGTNYIGFIPDLLSRITQKLRLDFTISLVQDGTYGRKIMESGGRKKWTGLIGDVVQKKADLAAAPLTITSSREEDIDFSHPIAVVKRTILMRKPSSPKPSFASIFQPFRFSLWFLIIITVVITSLALFTTARLSAREWHYKQDKKYRINQFSLFNSFWFIFGSLVLQGNRPPPRGLATRLISIAWWSFALIVLITYAVVLRDFIFVSPRASSPILSLTDLANQNRIQYGVINAGSTMNWINNSPDPTLQRMAAYFKANPSNLMRSTGDGVERVKMSSGNFAFIMETNMADFYVAKNCELMQIVDRRQDLGFYAFAFPNGSQYKEQFSRQIIDLHRSGDILSIWKKWFYEIGKCGRPSGGNSNADNSFPVGPPTLIGVFCLLYVILFIAIVIAIVEFIWRGIKSKKRGEKSVPGFLIHELKLRFCSCHGRIEDPEEESAKVDINMTEHAEVVHTDDTEKATSA